jgi:hypothetical protein
VSGCRLDSAKKEILGLLHVKHAGSLFRRCVLELHCAWFWRSALRNLAVLPDRAHENTTWQDIAASMATQRSLCIVIFSSSLATCAVPRANRQTTHMARNFLENLLPFRAPFSLLNVGA